MIATEMPPLTASEPRNDALVVREYDNWPHDEWFQGEYHRLWNEQRIPLPFTHPDWVQAWWNHFGSARRLVLLTVERDGALLAVAPLYADVLSFPPGKLRI